LSKLLIKAFDINGNVIRERIIESVSRYNTKKMIKAFVNSTEDCDSYRSGPIDDSFKTELKNATDL